MIKTPFTPNLIMCLGSFYSVTFSATTTIVFFNLFFVLSQSCLHRCKKSSDGGNSCIAYSCGHNSSILQMVLKVVNLMTIEVIFLAAFVMVTIKSLVRKVAG